MYELSVALKYLTPRWRQLSVSIISMISILVIALVVWLIVVFFSVTNGLEKNWIQKLIALTAPVRVTPTLAYYESFYYLIDGISGGSDYTLKTIGEKLQAQRTDPYDPEADEEPPAIWPKPDRLPNGELKDPVKIAFAEIGKLPGVPGLAAHDYEMTVSNLRLRLLRTAPDNAKTQAFLTQATYLGSLDPDNPALSRAILKTTPSDLSNLLDMVAIGSDNIQEDTPESIVSLNPESSRNKLKAFFAGVSIEQLKTASAGWPIARHLLPQAGKLSVGIVMHGNRVVRVIVPSAAWQVGHLIKQPTEKPYQRLAGTLEFTEQGILLDGNELPIHTPIVAAGDIAFPARLVETSLEKAHSARDLHFAIHLPLQGVSIAGEVPYRHLQIAKAEVQKDFATVPELSPLWFHQQTDRFVLPQDQTIGEGILLPKTFREAGILLGDRGYLSYYTPTASAVQEQRIPVFVAGFYDPGIIPIGGKFVLANHAVTALIRSSHNQEDTNLSNGINIRMANVDQAGEVKHQLQKAFEEAGIAPYWKVETYREFEFTRDLIQQLRSDKNLFTLISTVIIIVACSNIISMLIILVNDKKLEIGILRSMGATSYSIAFIFGFCGVVMGVIGSLIGTFAAVLTLRHLDVLVHFLSSLQGYNAFNPIYYGESLPNEVSFEALLFVIAVTAGISLLAGIVPAVKACLVRPSTILRSE